MNAPMNYELLVLRGTAAGPQLFSVKAEAPFMAISVGDVINQPGREPVKVTEIHHQFVGAPGLPPLHRLVAVVM